MFLNAVANLYKVEALACELESELLVDVVGGPLPTSFTLLGP